MGIKDVLRVKVRGNKKGALEGAFSIGPGLYRQGRLETRVTPPSGYS
jgi:hypothetical protein